ncbi:MAG: hypothetical protein ACYDCL_02105 [Myxococcales bacterium]
MLEQISIAPHARLPGGVDPVRLDAFRRDLMKRLRASAFQQAQK